MWAPVFGVPRCGRRAGNGVFPRNWRVCGGDSSPTNGRDRSGLARRRVYRGGVLAAGVGPV
eukprot:4951900-Lingulodinium_polyedra.AAC.1